jgi:hypothetical protein
MTMSIRGPAQRRLANPNKQLIAMLDKFSISKLNLKI